jgi:peptidase S24-like protein
MNSTADSRQNHPTRTFLRSGFALALALAGLCFGGCASYSPVHNLDLFTRVAPLPTLVPHGQQNAVAEADAKKHPGDFALYGEGSSMQPVYESGTSIVVHPCSYQALRKGMAVVYINRRGAYVAHMLVEEMPKGWFAIGLNNAEPDDDLVNADNFIGVVREAYASADTNFRPDIAARIAMKQALSTGTQVTLLR